MKLRYLSKVTRSEEFKFFENYQVPGVRESYENFTMADRETLPMDTG